VTFEHISEELRANGFEAALMGATQRSHPGRSGGQSRARDAEKLLYSKYSTVLPARESSDLDRFAAGEDCRFHFVPRCDQGKYAARWRTKMEWLLGELAKTEYPMSCPHGRPDGAALFGA
jgi:DNA mismatch repair protein MutL